MHVDGNHGTSLWPTSANGPPISSWETRLATRALFSTHSAAFPSLSWQSRLPLSPLGKWSSWPDSNRRPRAPQARALPAALQLDEWSRRGESNSLRSRYERGAFRSASPRLMEDDPRVELGTAGFKDQPPGRRLVRGKMVEVVGFELTASASRTRRATSCATPRWSREGARPLSRRFPCPGWFSPRCLAEAKMETMPGVEPERCVNTSGFAIRVLAARIIVMEWLGRVESDQGVETASLSDAFVLPPVGVVASQGLEP